MKNGLVWGASGAIGQAVLSKLKAEGWTTAGIVRDSLKTPQIAEFIFETRFDNPGDIEETAYLVSQDFSDINFWFYYSLITNIKDIYSGKSNFKH